ncbi:hypothetical protein HYPSUDRAFT_177683 [Hypholoma sublateritium FD-334 SS-4]|uniref:Alkaline phytoceramidase n=1 Tax=Hypholoma sublateritium (strain FD-334 SS-4) TaxID=945553 RepID=A0A0D2MWX6_HYPSF|nr:hypothetical protein HYPSUDRAFT_177683 [Hypholoma sublateritium FD-334 SS-4]
MLNLTTVAPWLQKQGIYGPVTATLDWCEINHQFSPYIAEIANSFSNLFTIGISLCGLREANVPNKELPTRYGIGYLGVALVGLGSFFFHATLLFEAQLADELPMIYVGSMSLFLLFDNKPGFGINNSRSQLLLVLLALFDVLFTWSYMIYRNPVYHQLVFGILVITTVIRVMYILKYTDAAERIPPKKKADIANFFTTGAIMFAVGFGVWNLDNIFCGHLTNWKLSLGWPWAFLLEGHSWWHVLTGLGTYYMYIGIQCESIWLISSFMQSYVLYLRTSEVITLCTKDDPKNYEVQTKWGMPHVKLIRSKVQ